MGFLSTTDQYVSDWDDFSIVPWHFEELFIKPWDEVADICKFRKFVDAKSRGASRKRLSTIIYANASYLNGSKKTSKDILTIRFLEQWYWCCKWLKDNHQDDAEGLEILGQRYSITLGCWQFLTPNISNVIHLAGLYFGDPDAAASQEDDRQRRLAKAKAIKELKGMWLEVEHKIAYLLREPKTIKMLKPTVIDHLAKIEEQVEWLSEESRP